MFYLPRGLWGPQQTVRKNLGAGNGSAVTNRQLTVKNQPNPTRGLSAGYQRKRRLCRYYKLGESAVSLRIIGVVLKVMARIYLPSTGPDDWRRLLGDPVKHWRTGYSAKTLAHCWETSNGLPTEIAALLHPHGDQPELLVAIPEHKVPLPGSSRGKSQNDLFVLARAGARTFAIAVEGKVNEPFDQPLGRWLNNASAGKQARLAYLCDLLGLVQPLADDVPYQLLHRTASAMIEARRFKTDAAAMIVHSFSPNRMWFDAFAKFVALFSVDAEPNKLLAIRPNDSPPLFVGWACGQEKFLSY